MIIVWVLVGLFASTSAHGLALKLIWAWFVVPIFGLPGLTLAQAIGLGLAGRMFSGASDVLATMSENQADTKAKLAESLVKGVLRPLIILGVAWVVTLFL